MRAFLLPMGVGLAMASPAAALDDLVLEQSQLISLSRHYAGVADNSDFESSESRDARVRLSDFYSTVLPFAPFDFQTGELLGATLAVSLTYRDLASVGLSGGTGIAVVDERYFTFYGYGNGKLIALVEDFYRPSLTCTSSGPVCLQLSEVKGDRAFAYDVTEAFGQTDFTGLPVTLVSESDAYFGWSDAPRPNFVATRDIGWEATFTLTWRYYQVAPGSEPPSVPEPATWALMLAGFGLVGSAARRARREPA